MTMLAPHSPPPTTEDIVGHAARAAALPLGLAVGGILGALALAVSLAATLAPRAAAPPLRVLTERPEIAPLAVSITPITAVSDGASGMLFSGDGYDVSCTTTAAASVLYPAFHNGTAWSILTAFPCTNDGSITKFTCSFPARRESGNTWNVFKTGAATVNSCTAVQRFGPIPSAKAPPSAGSLTGTVGATSGGTGQSTVTAGDLLVGGTNSWSKLAKGVSDGMSLQIVSGAVAWATSSSVTTYAVFGFEASPGSNATKYLCGTSGDACAAIGTAAQNRLGIDVIPTVSATLSGLTCTLGTAPGGGRVLVITVQKSANGGGAWSDTTLTCSITDPAKTCADGTHAPTASAGDIFAIKTVSAGGDGSVDLTCGFKVSG